ncbi:uncharacterized protein PG986_013953 [Apiospora aurea]|uniref:cellulase n=1 Tax=Apiospora aurea TaxID=335848 RepID=A0ABR1PX07_9PEZI
MGINAGLGALLAVALAGQALAQQAAYGGGNGWTGATTCVSGYTCSLVNEWYSQCIPGSGGGGGGGGGGACGKVKYAGVNIAGFDFGMSSSGVQQMRHFVNDDKFNIFRLPVGWQYLTNGSPTGNLDANNLARYDAFVQGCLQLGTYCIIDIHNYARYNGAVIGQGGPADDTFVALWTALANKYKSQSKIVFGVMNEPHDLTIGTWAQTVQKVVTAIRNTGATSQMILLPGTDYTSAANFISNGSGPELLKVKNPDGGVSGLIFDVHKYSDSDNSGTHVECTTNNIDNAFAPLATWLRSNRRQAFLSETGGGNVASCGTVICQQLDYINANNDVYLGWTSWAAGGFGSSYELVETPNGNSDTYIVSQCFAAKWKN